MTRSSQYESSSTWSDVVVVVHGTDNSKKHLGRQFSLHHIHLRAHELHIASGVSLTGIDLIRADVVRPFYVRTRVKRRVVLVVREGHLDSRECTFPFLGVVDREPIFDFDFLVERVALSLRAIFRLVEKIPDECMRTFRGAPRRGSHSTCFTNRL